jgi:hypothetical protein
VTCQFAKHQIMKVCATVEGQLPVTYICVSDTAETEHHVVYISVSDTVEAEHHVVYICISDTVGRTPCSVHVCIRYSGGRTPCSVTYLYHTEQCLSSLFSLPVETMVKIKIIFLLTTVQGFQPYTLSFTSLF